MVSLIAHGVGIEVPALGVALVVRQLEQDAVPPRQQRLGDQWQQRDAVHVERRDATRDVQQGGQHVGVLHQRVDGHWGGARSAGREHHERRLDVVVVRGRLATEEGVLAEVVAVVGREHDPGVVRLPSLGKCRPEVHQHVIDRLDHLDPLDVELATLGKLGRGEGLRRHPSERRVLDDVEVAWRRGVRPRHVRACDRAAVSGRKLRFAPGVGASGGIGPVPRRGGIPDLLAFRVPIHAAVRRERREQQEERVGALGAQEGIGAVGQHVGVVVRLVLALPLHALRCGAVHALNHLVAEVLVTGAGEPGIPARWDEVRRVLRAVHAGAARDLVPVHVLAHQPGPVAARLHLNADRGVHVVLEELAEATGRVPVRTDLGVVRVLAALHRRPGRAAPRGGVEVVGERHALGRHRLDLAQVRQQVLGQIVDEHEDDVRLLRVDRRSMRGDDEQCGGQAGADGEGKGGPEKGHDSE